MESAEKPKILIVDDVTENIRILIEIVKDDYATIPSFSGEEALKKLGQHDIDLILLDIMLPGIDGYEVCRQVKLNPLTAEIPVIFISALSEVMDDAKAFKVGGADYISKPFNPPTVKARVKNQIKLRKAILDLERLNKIL